MATPHQITIKGYASSSGIFQARPLKPGTLQKVSELLQMNHDSYHIYIHNLGLHNHILHHLLTIVALGGNTAQLQSAYDLAIDSQRLTRSPDADRVLDMTNPVEFQKYLGRGKYYDDYFAFFQNEISRSGVSTTVNEFLFKGDDRAEDMFQRFFSGFLHSPIHLGYSIEFDQPLVTAEALALTAVHDASFGSILALIERSTDASCNENLITIQEKLQRSNHINRAMDFTHGVSQIQNGFLQNSKEEFLQLIGSWKVDQHELEEKTAEALNSALYWTSAAQRPEKEIRFDFFLMHSITAGSFWPVLNNVPWINSETKCRLLEWKGRSDLMLYCQTGLPRPRLEGMHTYQPRIPSDWSKLFRRACDYQDDGHLAKFIRAIATASQISKPFFVSGSQFRLTREDQFLTIGHMVMDSAERFNRESSNRETEMICEKYEYPRTLPPEIQRVTARWPRHVGFEEAWFHVPARNTNFISQL